MRPFHVVAIAVAASAAPTAASSLLSPSGAASLIESSSVAGASGSGGLAAISALNADASALLASLFGKYIPSDGSVLHAALCKPCSAGAPSVLLFTGDDQHASMPAAALALSDVWVATIAAAEGGDAAEAVDRVFEHVVDALRRLPPPPEAAARHQLLLISPAPLPEDVIALQERLNSLWAHQSPLDGAAQAARPPRVSVRTAVCPPAATAGQTSGGAGGAQLLARFVQPDAADYLFCDARRVLAGTALCDVPCLLDELHAVLGGGESRQAGACAGTAREDWPALIGCSRALAAALERADVDARDLRTQLEESRLNPLPDFAEHADRFLGSSTCMYESAAARWGTSRVYQTRLEAMRRAAHADALRLLRLHLEIVRDDALTTFRSDLALLLAECAVGAYRKQTARLVKASAKRFERRSRDAVPRALTEQGIALAQRGSRALHRAMAVEVSTHQAEADELPPREKDVGPPPWWKQIGAQVIGIGFNLVQAYFLQYLPARHRDRADERMMPRGPLF